MGQSKIEIIATGNHGCDRDAQPGEELKRCEAPNCLDCRARDFVAEMQRAGAITFYEGAGEYARHTHWPATPGQVADDLVTGKRLGGKFRER